MSNWAKPPAARHQIVLIPETLDDLMLPDHPVRVFDRLLGQMDWGPGRRATTAMSDSRRFIRVAWRGPCCMA